MKVKAFQVSTPKSKSTLLPWAKSTWWECKHSDLLWKQKDNHVQLDSVPVYIQSNSSRNVSLEFICNKWNLCRQRTETHTDLLSGFHTLPEPMYENKKKALVNSEQETEQKKEFTFTEPLEVTDPSNTLCFLCFLFFLFYTIYKLQFYPSTRYIWGVK